MTSDQIRQSVTEQIVRALEGDGLPPWRKPWRADPNSGHPANAVTRKSYSGVNPLLLEIAAHRHGFTSRWWATFNQWSDLGGRVKARPAHVPPGRWGTQIVLCKPVKKTKVGDDGEEADESFFILRSYTVFNLDQVEGPFDRLRVGQSPLPSHEVERRYEHAEAVIEATGAEIRYGGDRAVYCRSDDYLQIPAREQFVLPEFYETVFHELVHWTEHAARLNWDRSKPENSYALGELVAELGGCYTSAELGLPVTENLSNHASYLRGWLRAMKGDTRFIFRATAQASRASDYILSFSRPAEPTTEPEAVLTA
jgi:antirestriction protein ArdC